MIKILLLEDDAILSDLMSEHFISMGYCVDVVANGEEALNYAESHDYDLYIFDINVPKTTGLNVLKALREYKDFTPTIMITAYQDLAHLKKGFQNQCDDYIKKPFELEELEQRVSNIVRHFHIDKKQMICITDQVSFDPDTKVLDTNGKTHALTSKEADILTYMIKHRGRAISSDEMRQNLWIYEDMPSDATLRVYIKNLRQAIGKDTITTIRGIGYTLE